MLPLSTQKLFWLRQLVLLPVLLLVLLSTMRAAMANAAEHCVILQYHHFSAQTPAATSVTPAQFQAHLDYLEANDFAVMAVQDVITLLENQQPLPERCVSLTVDDAYRSVYTEAFPRVREKGWPLTVFVNSAAVDQGKSAYMSWQQMREMADQGISFENHSHTHSHLVRRLESESADDYEQRIAAEILTAQNRISAELGITPKLFAYPYGEYNPTVVKLVQQFGLTGFGQQSGPAWPDANRHALPRFPMAAQYAELPGFITKVNSLPLPVVNASPVNPVLAKDEWRPELILHLAPDTFDADNLRCWVNGSDNVSLQWQAENQLSVKPNFNLPVGRSRTNCTMPSNRKGRFHWYSHNWIRRHADGRWYKES